MKPLQEPIWTENKAKLIERYLYFFVMITKHGTYIDGFAGPQKVGKPAMWAAKAVLETEPKWIRHFYLFDRDKKQVERLRRLQARHRNRDVEVHRGDFNVMVKALLESGKIRQKEATFCLLDQRTFECHWSTLEELAKYKKTGNKVELFYFLPQFWLDRALKGQKQQSVLDRWWGRSDWAKLRGMRHGERRDAFVKRFETELGYAFVAAWPIFMRKNGKEIMYYMIHATDHFDAPKLMRRAYAKAVQPKEPLDQLALEFGLSPAAKTASRFSGRNILRIQCCR
jgi:three-Cys-motif partner protein